MKGLRLAPNHDLFTITLSPTSSYSHQHHHQHHHHHHQWEPVEYFNNKVICDLVEERHKGILAVLDEECLRPGDVSDSTFLAKLMKTVPKHKHLVV